jgi:uncharacterized protein
MAQPFLLKGRGVVPGRAAGAALPSRRPFMFAHGVEPFTGVVIDVRSDILGKNIKGKVLCFPSGKGSTTGSAWLLETIRLGNGPAAVINAETEPIIATGLILGQLLYGVTIPLVDRLGRQMADLINDGTFVEVDGSTGKVVITPWQPA